MIPNRFRRFFMYCLSLNQFQCYENFVDGFVILYSLANFPHQNLSFIGFSIVNSKNNNNPILCKFYRRFNKSNLHKDEYMTTHECLKGILEVQKNTIRIRAEDYHTNAIVF